MTLLRALSQHAPGDTEETLSQDDNNTVGIRTACPLDAVTWYCCLVSEVAARRERRTGDWGGLGRLVEPDMLLIRSFCRSQYPLCIGHIDCSLEYSIKMWLIDHSYFRVSSVRWCDLLNGLNKRLMNESMWLADECLNSSGNYMYHVLWQLNIPHFDTQFHVCFAKRYFWWRRTVFSVRWELQFRM